MEILKTSNLGTKPTTELVILGWILTATSSIILINQLDLRVT